MNGKKFKLNNGMSVVYAGHSKAYSVCLSVNIGHVNEPKLGIAGLFEKVLLLQAKGFVPVFGGTMTAYLTGGDDLEEVVAKIADIFTATVINEKFVEEAKAIITKETLDRAPLIDRRMRLMYKHTAFGAELVKTTEEYLDALNSYSVEEVKEFANTYYVGANAVLVIAGPTFPDSELKELTEEYFGDIPSGKAAPKFTGDLYTGGYHRIEVGDDFKGSRVMLGWDLKHLYEWDSAPANVMMTMFKGRLERALAECGITDFTLEWKIAGYYGLRTMRVYLTSPTASPKELVDVVAAVIKRICETEATDERMEKSRTRATMEKFYKFEKSDDKALEMAWQMVGRGHTYSVDARIDGIYKVTAHDVKVVSRDVFRKPSPTYIVAAASDAEAYSYEELWALLGVTNQKA